VSVEVLAGPVVTHRGLVAQLGLDPGHHDVHDVQDLALAELVEDDRVVDPVEELGPEMLLEFVVDLERVRDLCNCPIWTLTLSYVDFSALLCGSTGAARLR
jgi:hypothetical protein